MRHRVVPQTVSHTTALSFVSKEPADSDQHDAFYRWLFRRAGISLEHYRRPSFVRRLSACLRAVGAESQEDAKQAIEDDPSLLSKAIDAVLLGVTEFYRDPLVFDEIREAVLPRLCQRRRRLRIWSAACSEGQELYSVAMMLADLGWLDQAELVGSDCREEAIRSAEAGRFHIDSTAGLPPGLSDRYFTKTGDYRDIQPMLGQNIRWTQSDLLDGVEAGPWDMVLWRNMAIYLTPTAAASVWQSVVDTIRPGGFLITGKADHPPPGLGLMKVSPCIYELEISRNSR